MSPLATFIATADKGSRVLICPISSSLSSGNTQSHCVLSGSVLVGWRETPLKRRKVSISLSQATWTISAYKQRKLNCYAQDGCKVRLGFIECEGGSPGVCLATAQILGEARSVTRYGIQVAGAEGFSGQNWGYTDWEATVPMQLQRGGRLGSRPTYAAPWIQVQKSRLHENSDLRSK